MEKILTKKQFEAKLQTLVGKNVDNILFAGTTFVPKKFKIVDVAIGTFDNNGTSIQFDELVLQCTETNKRYNYSLNRLFDMVLLGTESTKIKFKNSRVESSLRGAGVIDGTKQINETLLQPFASEKLTRKETIARLFDVELTSKQVNVIEYFPTGYDSENIDNNANLPKAEELQNKDYSEIAGLTFGKKYQITM